MVNEDKGKFLTVAEVAEIMRVSKMTVYRLVHSGELPAVRVGRSFRVNETAVSEYLESSVYDVGKSKVSFTGPREDTRRTGFHGAAGVLALKRPAGML